MAELYVQVLKSLFMVYSCEEPFIILHGKNKNRTKERWVHANTVYKHFSHMRASSIRTRNVRYKSFSGDNKIVLSLKHTKSAIADERNYSYACTRKVQRTQFSERP